MAKCEKCGNEYLTRECLKCKDREYSEKITKNNQNIYNKEKQYTNANSNKTILIIIAIAVVIIAFLLTAKEYRREQQEKQIAKMFYGTDDMDKIEKINKKLEKENEKNMKILRKMFLPE